MYMPVFAFVLWLFTIRKNGITMIAESLLCIIFIYSFTGVDPVFIDKIFILFGKNPILEWVHFSLKSLGYFG
jgi:ABC-type multidrug transport system permease subunit